ncbi:hypothetical protein [Sphingomonas sp.]|uniref:hypothetical protein n=1 Tax=Sphingomonas sp. TaxID=28214 RepID=UPI003B3AFAF7
MNRRTKRLFAALAGTAALAVALPALGQDAPQSILPPGFGNAPPRPAAPAPGAPAPGPAAGAPLPPVSPNADEAVAVSTPSLLPADIGDLADAEVKTPDEIPDGSRRPLERVGTEAIYGEDAFGDADGRYVVTLMRRMQAPIASRWAEIMLRRVLLGVTPAPPGEGKADWVADRAALLLRMGEADSARMLVQGVDVDRFSPRLRRVAIATALATSDPQGLCPLPDGNEEVGGQPAWPMIRAMCATMAGDQATANATIGRAPPNDPIDHALAEKLIAAGGGGRRQIQLDWAAVDSLTDWRFGLATALGVTIPQNLLDSAPISFQAWLARSPYLTAADRVAPARVAAALGVLSNADLVDLYGRVMDEAGDQDTNSPSGRLRAAYRGDDDDARVAAMHALWDAANTGEGNERDRYAASILTARAAQTIVPSTDLKDDVAPLIASLFSAGFDVQAERWANVVNAATGADGERAWSMLAVGASRPVMEVDASRVRKFIERAGTSGAQRSALLISALAGLGRLPDADAAKLAARVGVTLGQPSAYGSALRRAVSGGQRGTVALLVATGMQAPSWSGVPAADFYQMISALRAVGLENEARMISAEAMARL